MRLLLCSGSPRRREFLERLGLAFDVLSPDIDESRGAGEHVDELPVRLAREKALAGVAAWRGKTGREPLAALGADTVVAIDDDALGKPRDRADAADMLRRLSGRVHRVVSGVCVVSPAGVEALGVVTEVRFAKLTEPELAWLVDSGDGDDKAGAYGVQGLASGFVERVDGSITNVVGLPMTETLALLRRARVPLPWDRP